MDWEAPAIVLDARSYSEGDAIVAVMAEERGVFRGLARGGAGRQQAAMWQAGNLVQARWVARLQDQLGVLTGELVHPAAALLMDDQTALAVLMGACAVAEGAMPEREPHPRVFSGLLRLIVGLLRETPAVPDLVRWELTLLADLGYGLDLSVCAVTGEADDLAWVSPKTGRAVSDAAAGVWRERLLKLPGFLREGDRAGTIEDWQAGLRLTGHFLERDAFGHVHKPLPLARRMLYEHVARLAELETNDAG